VVRCSRRGRRRPPRLLSLLADHGLRQRHRVPVDRPHRVVWAIVRDDFLELLLHLGTRDRSVEVGRHERPLDPFAKRLGPLDAARLGLGVRGRRRRRRRRRLGRRRGHMGLRGHHLLSTTAVRRRVGRVVWGWRHGWSKTLANMNGNEGCGRRRLVVEDRRWCCGRGRYPGRRRDRRPHHERSGFRNTGWQLRD
jgi:hypothetical protein